MSRRNSWDDESPLPRVRLSTAAAKIYEREATRLAEELTTHSILKEALENHLLDAISHKLGLSKYGQAWRIESFGRGSGFATRLAQRAGELADELLPGLKLDPSKIVLSASDRKELQKTAQRHYFDIIEEKMEEWAKAKAEADFLTLVVPILEEKLKGSSMDILIEFGVPED